LFIIYLAITTAFYFEKYVKIRAWDDLQKNDLLTSFKGEEIDIRFKHLNWKTTYFKDSNYEKKTINELLIYLEKLDNDYHYIMITDYQIYNAILNRKDFSPVKYWFVGATYPHINNPNREKFEIYAYSIGPKRDDYMRQKLIQSVDVFDDVSQMSDRDIALLARQDEIDIAIDLKGYTHQSRTGIFAFRAAPIQINYLGYPGTMGADFMDYIIADRIIIPEDLRDCYTEEIIYMPNSYQPNNNERPISTREITKSNMGLPENSFVFCSFNNVS